MSDVMKVFRVERSGDTTIVVPQGITAEFRYFEVHTESNTVIKQLDQHGVDKLVVDLAELEKIDAVIVDSIIRMVRRVTNRGGKATICGASDSALKTLRSMRLDTLWPYFLSRAEALQSLQEQR